MQSEINEDDHEAWIKNTFDPATYSDPNGNPIQSPQEDKPFNTNTKVNSKDMCGNTSKTCAPAPITAAEFGGKYRDGKAVRSPTASRPRAFDPTGLSPTSSPLPSNHSSGKHLEPPSPVPPHIQAVAGDYISHSGDWLSWTKFVLTLETDGTFCYRFHFEDHSARAWGEEEMIGTWTATQSGIVATTHHQSVEGKVEINRTIPCTEFADMDIHGRWIFFNSIYLHRSS
jgi:hypothetical protein